MRGRAACALRAHLDVVREPISPGYGVLDPEPSPVLYGDLSAIQAHELEVADGCHDQDGILCNDVPLRIDDCNLVFGRGLQSGGLSFHGLVEVLVELLPRNHVAGTVGRVDVPPEDLVSGGRDPADADLNPALVLVDDLHLHDDRWRDNRRRASGQQKQYGSCGYDSPHFSLLQPSDRLPAGSAVRLADQSSGTPNGSKGRAAVGSPSPGESTSRESRGTPESCTMFPESFAPKVGL